MRSSLTDPLTPGEETIFVSDRYLRSLMQALQCLKMVSGLFKGSRAILATITRNILKFIEPL